MNKPFSYDLFIYLFITIYESIHLLICGAVGFSYLFCYVLSAAALKILKRYLFIFLRQQLRRSMVEIALSPKGGALKYGIHSFTYSMSV